MFLEVDSTHLLLFMLLTLLLLAGQEARDHGFNVDCFAGRLLFVGISSTDFTITCIRYGGCCST